MDNPFLKLAPLVKQLNRLVGAILTSRFHGLMSSNTMLLEFEGRRSGRSLQVPVSYDLQGDEVRCFTLKELIWWKNLLLGKPVHVTIRGERHEGVPTVTIDDPDAMIPALSDFYSAVPRDRRASRVGIDERGRPREEDIAGLIPDMVYINIQLDTRT